MLLILTSLLLPKVGMDRLFWVYLTVTMVTKVKQGIWLARQAAQRPQSLIEILMKEQ